MIPELGHFALITALAVAIVQGFVPLLGARELRTRLGRQVRLEEQP